MGPSTAAKKRHVSMNANRPAKIPERSSNNEPSEEEIMSANEWDFSETSVKKSNKKKPTAKRSNLRPSHPRDSKSDITTFKSEISSSTASESDHSEIHTGGAKRSRMSLSSLRLPAKKMKKTKYSEPDPTYKDMPRNTQVKRVEHLPGFHAFAQQGGEDVKQYRGVKQAMEPQTGIHSQSWADAVLPQSCLLLKLPIEIRYTIFEDVISSFNEGKSIEPHKRGNAYSDPEWLNASAETESIKLVCKQLYLDIDAGGWLYRFKSFNFPGYGLLRQFLWAIKPSHKNALRTIHLDLRIGRTYPKSLNKSALVALAGLKGLQYLRLTITFDSALAKMHWSRGHLHKGLFDLDAASLDKIRKNEYLKGVVNLLEFQLNVEIEDHEKWIPQPSLQKQLDDMEDELRKVMLIPQVHDELRKSNAKLRGLDVEEEVN